MFQELWQTGLHWKQKLPKHIADVWLEFRNELHQLQNIEIDRWIQLGTDTKKLEIHGFCDASEKAYAAVIYSRVVTRGGSIQVTMLTSKTRVAPIKPITLPRLELCGAVLLANLMGNVQTDLCINNEDIHTWTDSTVVLGWLRTNPAKLKNLCGASRGISPAELIDHPLWWNGPDCLKEHKSSWEQNLDIPLATLELKTKVISTFVLTSSDDVEAWITKYSDFTRLIRITAICLKFIENAQSTKETRISTLYLTSINNLRQKKRQQLIITADDLRKAQLRIIRLHQGKEFAREIHHLAENKPINKKSKILSLNPFLDSDGCLRVGGRLQESNLTYERKHPLIIAPGKVAHLMISKAHENSLHGGTRLTMNLVRESYKFLAYRFQFVKEPSHSQYQQHDPSIKQINKINSWSWLTVDFWLQKINYSRGAWHRSSIPIKINIWYQSINWFRAMYIRAKLVNKSYPVGHTFSQFGKQKSFGHYSSLIAYHVPTLGPLSVS